MPAKPMMAAIQISAGPARIPEAAAMSDMAAAPRSPAIVPSAVMPPEVPGAVSSQGLVSLLGRDLDSMPTSVDIVSEAAAATAAVKAADHGWPASAELAIANRSGGSPFASTFLTPLSASSSGASPLRSAPTLVSRDPMTVNDTRTISHPSPPASRIPMPTTTAAATPAALR